MPVTRPGADGIVYLRGRDGNDIQVQVSDDFGYTFFDLSDYTWASSKFAVALLPDPLKPLDMVLIFSDDDIYRSDDGGLTWEKSADAAVTQREAARHPIDESDLILAGQGAGAGELHYSPNYGVTNEDVGDAAMDIVNAIEVSR